MRNSATVMVFIFLILTAVRPSLAGSYQDVYCQNSPSPLLYARKGMLISRDFKTAADCEGLLSLLRAQSVSTQYITAWQDRDLKKGFRQAAGFENVGFSQKFCEVKAHRYHLTKNQNGYIVPECTPEILYSWGGFDKLNWFVNNMGNSKSWPSPMPRGLFTTSSAAGTFGYGPVAIRIKVKPSVRFKLAVSPAVSTCAGYFANGTINRESAKNTIVSRLDLRADGLSFLEYTICSSEVIDSWSYGKSEHFDEILRDHNWMLTKNYFFWDAYAKNHGVDVYLDNTLDQAAAGYMTIYSIESIQKRMGLLRALIQGGFGQIMAQNPEARARHFKVARPNYYIQSIEPN